MFPKLLLNFKVQNRQSGSALVIAIFIITVITLLGTALVKIVSSNAETVAYEVIGTRAYQAAQAGLQIKLREVFPLKPNNDVCVDGSYDFSFIQGLNSCSAVEVTCTGSEILGVTYYTITSTGLCKVGGVLTTRRLEVKARSLE